MFRGRSLYLIDQCPHCELPAIDSQCQPAILFLEKINRPFLTRAPMLDPISDDDWPEWQHVVMDVTLPSDLCPTKPFDLIGKLRSGDFFHDWPHIGFPPGNSPSPDFV